MMQKFLYLTLKYYQVVSIEAKKLLIYHLYIYITQKSCHLGDDKQAVLGLITF